MLCENGLLTFKGKVLRFVVFLFLIDDGEVQVLIGKVFTELTLDGVVVITYPHVVLVVFGLEVLVHQHFYFVESYGKINYLAHTNVKAQPPLFLIRLLYWEIVVDRSNDYLRQRDLNLADLLLFFFTDDLNLQSVCLQMLRLVDIPVSESFFPMRVG